ncbi:MAG: MarR family transcriptional regulator [Kofleriaceae bacterium]|nr:MAG: MarR family transcriptional regulator [Kofleriaceae bacterium]MBZ0233951.1 MarR family transcriptional regulator [Kofleriaceae bacterium]
MEQDAVDQIVGQWREIRADLDLKAMALVGRLGRVGGLLERAIAAALAKHDLSIADFDVLASLRRAGPPHRLNPTHFARALMLTSGAITNRLDRLAARALIERLDDPADRRGTLVALTARGKALVDAAVGDHVANEARLLAALTRAERTELDRLLRKLMASLEAP